MKENLKQAVQYWLSACRQHEYETEGFTVCIHDLTDADLVRMKMVTGWFLDFAPFMFRIIHPKETGRLRGALAYLNELRNRQEETIRRHYENQSQRFTLETNRVATWVQKHITNR